MSIGYDIKSEYHKQAFISSSAAIYTNESFLQYLYRRKYCSVQSGFVIKRNRVQQSSEPENFRQLPEPLPLHSVL